MKHEEIYCTCDRCGTRLKNNVRFLKYVEEITHLKRPLKIKTETVEPFSQIYGEEIKEIDKEKSVLEMKIATKYKIREKHLDLCADCRKAFERFMKNEV